MSIEELRKWALKLSETAAEYADDFEDDAELSDMLLSIAELADGVKDVCDEREPPELEFE